MNAIAKIIEQAKKRRAVIVLPEGGDARVVTAAARAAAQGLAEVLIIGEAHTVAAAAKSGGVDAGELRVIDPCADAVADDTLAKKYAAVLTRALAHKGMTHARALAEIRAPLTRAMCMVACGDADGCVAGAANTTTDVIRAALQIVGVKSGNHSRDDNNINTAAKNTIAENNLVSSFFIMLHQHPHQALQGAAIFADCALVVEPSAEQLARIAIDSTDSAVALIQLSPRVALLSFSTAGSARHPQVDKVRRTGEIIAALRPDIALLPEVQFDAAVIPEILARKAPDIKTKAPANIFIFPDLQSANIGYKIAERIGAATAVGPILQGLKRPVNDLSRGCSVEDIVSLIAVTAVQAQTH